MITRKAFLGGAAAVAAALLGLSAATAVDSVNASCCCGDKCTCTDCQCGQGSCKDCNCANCEGCNCATDCCCSK